MAGQRREIDGNLALWVAVIRIDADHFKRPGAARSGDFDGIANAKLHAPRQLFADEAGIAGAKADPGIFGRLQQRPVIAVGGVIGEAENFDRRPVDLGIGPAARQDGLDFGALLEPRPDGDGLPIVRCVDVDVRGQSSVEPADKSPAEGFDHGADADIDREREQQRH